MELPKAVHRVTSRGREYFYFQEGRNTDRQGPRIRLPNDPHSPEFWNAIRQAQGLTGAVPTDTVGALIDAYLASPALAKLATDSQALYRRSLKIAATAWGSLPAAGLRPSHVQAMMDQLGATPAKANNFLGAMRTLSSWGRVREHLDQSLTDGVKPYEADDGHKPWTPEQIRCAHERLTGAVRRGVLLALYTGQRGSDVVRLGWTDIEDDGFDLRQRKNGRQVYCPIVDELAAEMAGWEKRPGPFLLQDDGRPYTRKRLSIHFADAREAHPVLAGTTLHGLRATAVIRLRRQGLSTAQIQDIIGMSMAMIERYSRFADRKANGKAALVHLNRTVEEQSCKTLKNWKTET